ncbi:MAG: GNAT family N-acetyltransferase [Actinomycetota bacterium]
MTEEKRLERWNSLHPRWSELMSLPNIEDLHLEEKAEEWHLGIYTLVALRETQITGVLRFWTQVIGVDEDKPPLIVDGEPAVEAKIVTFHVLDEFRRRGIGRSLELAAVGWARELGCYQVRTRSAYNRTGNHDLKASLGFGISPGRDRPDGSEDLMSWLPAFVIQRQIDRAGEGGLSFPLSLFGGSVGEVAASLQFVEGIVRMSLLLAGFFLLNRVPNVSRESPASPAPQPEGSGPS